MQHHLLHHLEQQQQQQNAQQRLATSSMPVGPAAAAGANWNNQQYVGQQVYQQQQVQAVNHQQQQHISWAEQAYHHEGPSPEDSLNYSPSQSLSPTPTKPDLIRVDSKLLAGLAVSIWPACVSKPESATSTTYTVRPRSIPDKVLDQLSNAKV